MRGPVHGFIRERFLPAVKSLALACVYEDAETHHHATRFYEFLLQELEDDAELNATWWRIELMSDPKLSHAAGRAVASANLIAFSVRLDEAPTSHARLWIESWPEESMHLGKLIVLLQSPRPDSALSDEWDSYLRDFSNRRRMFYLPGPASEFLSSSSSDSSGTDTPPLNSSRSIEPYLHWGLNE